MYLNNFYGNHETVKTLISGFLEGKLPHAIILNAKEGLGVNHLARLLAAKILNADYKDVYNQALPSLTVIKGEGAANQIKVSEIRDMTNNISYSSLENDKKVVIIKNCENFNRYSANALLKSLEEPKGDTTYILTTNDLTKLLPTIRSRCAIYTLTEPSESEVLDYFKEYINDEKFKSAFNIYKNNIGFIQKAINDDEEYNCLYAAATAYDVILKNKTYDLSKLMFSFNKSKDSFIKFLKNLEFISQKNIDEKHNRILSVINEYKKHLQINVNLNLLLENFVVDITK